MRGAVGDTDKSGKLIKNDTDMLDGLNDAVYIDGIENGRKQMTDTPLMKFWQSMNLANRAAGYPDLMFGQAKRLFEATCETAQREAMAHAVACPPLPEPTGQRWFDREPAISERFS